ncbi:hypothetical protein RRG08_018358 [Elysia crispata]|uniref:Uncharacterized protein n=1 Tax=Elysia crispata TaxID=231223 RepID=A0AAE1A866_9GAST|nr:hypothetical protein RRG08_018358 [Elysia crispata]
MPVHYCRKRSSKKYFERTFNSKMEIYRVYREWCGERNLVVTSRQVFVDEFDEGNSAIFRPRKDQCDIPGKKAGEPQVADTRALQYTPEGEIKHNLVLNEDWRELNVRGNSTRIEKQPKALFGKKRPIAAAIFKHLQKLKTVIPGDILMSRCVEFS